MGYFSRIIGPVAIAAMVAPATVQAADDVEALRAEIAALKTEYAQRVTALETRIDQLETSCNGGDRRSSTGRTAAPGAVGTSPQILGVQSCRSR